MPFCSVVPSAAEPQRSPAKSVAESCLRHSLVIELFVLSPRGKESVKLRAEVLDCVGHGPELFDWSERPSSARIPHCSRPHSLAGCKKNVGTDMSHPNPEVNPPADRIKFWLVLCGQPLRQIAAALSTPHKGSPA